ncbi:MAG TPA: ABC transporter permease subunit [Chloroflexota bacterium]|nr:ABC transporter permease subunit [Chloroflexota bacterium]
MSATALPLKPRTSRWAGTGRGIVLGLRALLAKELRSRSRSGRSVWLLTGYLGGMALVMAGFLALIVRAGGIIFPTMGTQLFSSLALGLVLLLAFITPALTVGAISGERERRTLDLLLVTRASALGLVGGKLLGSLFYVLFLLALSLPAFALVYLFGGVPLRYLALTLFVATATAIAHASFGLLLSALLRRTAAASVVAYVAVFWLVLAMPFVSAVIGLAGQGQSGRQPSGPPPAYLYASPMLALASVLPAGSATPGLPLVGDMMRFVLFYAGRSQPITTMGTISSITHAAYAVPYPAGAQPPLAVSASRSGPETVVTLAPWIHHALISAGITILSVLGATLLLLPVKPWQSIRLRLQDRGPGSSQGRTSAS